MRYMPDESEPFYRGEKGNESLNRRSFFRSRRATFVVRRYAASVVTIGRSYIAERYEKREKFQKSILLYSCQVITVARVNYISLYISLKCTERSFSFFIETASTSSRREIR